MQQPGIEPGPDPWQGPILPLDYYCSMSSLFFLYLKLGYFLPKEGFITDITRLFLSWMSQWIKKKKPAVQISNFCDIQGFEVIEPTLNELENKMREGMLFIYSKQQIAERAPHDGKRKQESIWPIYQIHHQRSFPLFFIVTYSRFIWESFKKGEISREVYDYCIKNKLADQNLIAMWKKVSDCL